MINIYNVILPVYDFPCVTGWARNKKMISL